MVQEDYVEEEGRRGNEGIGEARMKARMKARMMQQRMEYAERMQEGRSVKNKGTPVGGSKTKAEEAGKAAKGLGDSIAIKAWCP